MTDLEIFLASLCVFLYFSGFGATYSIILVNPKFKSSSWIDTIFWIVGWWALAFMMFISIVTKIFLVKVVNAIYWFGGYVPDDEEK